MGITVPMPIYNRQQGNLAKAQQIVAQTQAQFTSLENSVAAEVEAAYNAVVDTRDDMDGISISGITPPTTSPSLPRNKLPKDEDIVDHDDKLDRFVRKLIKERFTRDENNYYNWPRIEHRKSLLRINTACACTVWGNYPSLPTL